MITKSDSTKPSSSCSSSWQALSPSFTWSLAPLPTSQSPSPRSNVVPSRILTAISCRDLQILTMILSQETKACRPLVPSSASVSLNWKIITKRRQLRPMGTLRMLRSAQSMNRSNSRSWSGSILSSTSSPPLTSFCVQFASRWYSGSGIQRKLSN